MNSIRNLSDNTRQYLIKALNVLLRIYFVIDFFWVFSTVNHRSEGVGTFSAVHFCIYLFTDCFLTSTLNRSNRSVPEAQIRKVLLFGIIGILLFWSRFFQNLMLGVWGVEYFPSEVLMTTIQVCITVYKLFHAGLFALSLILSVQVECEQVLPGKEDYPVMQYLVLGLIAFFAGSLYSDFLKTLC